MDVTQERKVDVMLFANAPDIWGEGLLFAFSGIDGPTCVDSDFVLTSMSDKLNWLIHLSKRRVFSIEANECDLDIVTGDVVKAGDVLVTYSKWHTIVGRIGKNTTVSLRDEKNNGLQGDNVSTSSNDSLVLKIRDDRFSLAYGQTEIQAHQRAQAGLQCNLEDVISQRMEFFEGSPRLNNSRYQKLLNKLLSVMKVNSLTPEGPIKYPWSTPDRVPHKAMWLWDSVFHSMGMNRMEPQLAENYLRSVLGLQQADGMIAHMADVKGYVSVITQPPVLAWGVLENYQYLKDKQKLSETFPLLENYLAWNIENRDQNGNMLFEWLIEGNPLCRSGESGMDNSPRFDEAATLDSVDFSVFMAHDAKCLAEIAGIIGLPERAEHWRLTAEIISQQIHKELWNEELQFYCDKHLDGHFSPVQAISGFLPLLLEDIPQDRVGFLVDAMLDPKRFATAFPLPSVAICESTWSTDMWRGATWINYNYFIIQGLEKHGRPKQALELASKTVYMVNKYYEKFGVTFEYYDAKDEVSPILCDRKGSVTQPYNIGVKMDSIRDYHWTAALTAILIMDYDSQL